MKVVLETERLRLVLPGPEKARLLVRHYLVNAEFRGPWDPPRPATFLTDAHWRRALTDARREYASRSSMRLVILDGERDAETIAGTCNFTQVLGGECRLGYGLDERYEGKGYMSEALGAAIPFAFERLRVERIRASYLPRNARSARLLERLGFTKRGPERQVVGKKVVTHVGVELTRERHEARG